MSRFAGFILVSCALAFLAGCATTSNEPVPPVWTATNAPPQPVLIQTNRPVTPVVPTSPPRVVAFRPPPTPVTTWMSLSLWASEHKIGQPHRLSDMPVAAYAIGSANGVMVLVIGSHEATWNGVQIHLGFDPQLINNQVYLHGLDLQKNLEPLLCGPPLTVSTNHVIVIDPGHGGINAGTHSVLDGHLEKEYTLDWAERLAPLLATNGWTVFLTRTDDTDIALSNRVAFAEAHHADLFLSLHFNSGAPDKRPAGIETYCLTPTGMPSTLTRGWPDVWSQAFPNNAYDAQNVQLAFRLQNALVRETGLEDRGVNRARFIGVLHGQHRPAVLIEAGYLSNPHEARLIESPEFRQKLAEAVADALK